MQSVNNNPIKSITINKSQCSNKNRIFKIQTSCFSVTYKHRPGARVHSVLNICVQLPVPHAVSLEEAEVMDNTQPHFIAKVNAHIYCLLSSVILLTLLKFGLLSFNVFNLCVLFDTKTGKIFPLMFSKQNKRLYRLVTYETPSFG